MPSRTSGCRANYRRNPFGIDRVQRLGQCGTVSSKGIVPNRRSPEFIDYLEQPAAFAIAVDFDLDGCSVAGDALTQRRANRMKLSFRRSMLRWSQIKRVDFICGVLGTLSRAVATLVFFA